MYFKSLVKSEVLAIAILLLVGYDDLAAQIAVVVHPKNPHDEISFSHLSRIFEGEIGHWKFARKQRNPIVLVDHKTEIANKFYKLISNLSPLKIRMKWIGKMLEGEWQRLPHTMESQQEALTIVTTNSGAIGFVNAQFLADSAQQVKVLKIDGKSVGEQDYPLK